MLVVFIITGFYILEFYHRLRRHLSKHINKSLMVIMPQNRLRQNKVLLMRGYSFVRHKLNIDYIKYIFYILYTEFSKQCIHWSLANQYDASVKIADWKKNLWRLTFFILWVSAWRAFKHIWKNIFKNYFSFKSKISIARIFFGRKYFSFNFT